VKGTLRYGLAGIAGLGIAVALLWPWLDAPARRGVAVAAAVAWLVQVGAFAALNRARERMRPFLAAWAGGTVVRMGVIVAAAGAAWLGDLPPASTLLALAGFFFGLLLLEPLFFEGPEVSLVDENRSAGGRDAW